VVDRREDGGVGSVGAAGHKPDAVDPVEPGRRFAVRCDPPRVDVGREERERGIDFAMGEMALVAIAQYCDSSDVNYLRSAIDHDYARYRDVQQGEEGRR
jgi:hypothetical protein